MSALDAVVFENMKPSYSVNEDIRVIYAVNKEVRTSSRDWIGLFRKGWTGTEEQIVFEWTTGRPTEETLPRRRVTFCAKDFTGRINLHDQYQFAYVSKLYKVLGKSQFFTFNVNDHTESTSPIITYYNSEPDDELLEKLPAPLVCSGRVENFKRLPAMTFSHLELPLGYTSDYHAGKKLPMRECSANYKITEEQFTSKLQGLHINQMSSTPSSSLAPTIVDTLAHPSLPPNHSCDKLTNKKCPTCSCPSDYMLLNRGLRDKIVAQAEQVRSLEAKITDLRRELEFCQVSQQQLKVKADMACKEKDNYCAFVRQFLESLKRKGQLKIVDTEGNTIMVKNVTPQINDSQPRKHSTVACNVPHCSHMSLKEQLRQELASELKQVCRQYCEETENLQSKEKDSPDTAGNVPPVDEINLSSSDLNPDVSSQIPSSNICVQQYEDGNIC